MSLNQKITYAQLNNLLQGKTETGAFINEYKITISKQISCNEFKSKKPAGSAAAAPNVEAGNSDVD
jgi:hypothetical protein